MQKHNPQHKHLTLQQIHEKIVRASKISEIQRRFYEEVEELPVEVLNTPKPAVEIQNK